MLCGLFATRVQRQKNMVKQISLHTKILVTIASLLILLCLVAYSAHAELARVAQIAALPREVADAVSSAGREILISSMIALMVGVAAGLVLVRNVAASFGRATRSALAIAKGDLAQAALPVGSNEIGQLGQAFNDLRARVESMLRSTTGTAATVSVSAQKVHSAAEEISVAIADVALQVSSVASASTEMAGASEEIARNCEMAAQSAMSATQTAQNGSQIVGRQIELMRRIAGTVDTSSKCVASLGERSMQIGTIIGTIHEIADQTNLLALNAAIEAARAGEQGRGFAVVADEVRKLAERTTKETQQISVMIKAIQDETEAAVAAMESGMQQVDAGTSEAAKSEAALREIIAQIDTVSSQVSHIAAAAEEQTATTEEISGNMHSIAAAVDKTADECRTTTQVANGMTGIAEQIMAGMSAFTLAEDTALSLQKAKSAHMIFIGKIKAHLDGTIKLDADTLPTHLTCGFGKWYQQQGNTSCGHIELFKAIDAPHARVHQLGKQALEAHAAGDKAKARALCAEMKENSMALVGMLDQLLEQPCGHA